MKIIICRAFATLFFLGLILWGSINELSVSMNILGCIFWLVGICIFGFLGKVFDQQDQKEN